MQLTVYTDYSLRVLMYLGVHRDNVSTIADIANSYSISRNHIVKVVHNLASLGFIRTIRGRHGGMLLAREPEAISVADVVRKTEPSFILAECFSPSGDCRIDDICKLKIVLNEACQGFFTILGRYTLADLLNNRQELVGSLRENEIPLRRVAQL